MKDIKGEKGDEGPMGLKGYLGLKGEPRPHPPTSELGPSSSQWGSSRDAPEPCLPPRL